MLQCTQQGDALTVHLCGEIDHCAAEGLRNEIEMQIVRQNAKRLILDFSQVTFMDSSGVGMIIGRYISFLGRGGSFVDCCLLPSIDRLFHVGVVNRIFANRETVGRETHE